MMPERDMLAVVRGSKESHWMIKHASHPVKAYTDHKGMTNSMANRGHLHGKEFEYRYRSCKNKVMRLADGMSRLPEALKDDAKPI
ncbi:hypothetical protein BKA60DRAFT_587582 [Fusarium oxysporum]|nr:hypothetical protein BKA60DRAFT_587582 [Fusarium oxysporum]